MWKSLNRKSTIVVLEVLICVAFVVRQVVVDVRSMAWVDQAESRINKLALLVEEYRAEHGKSPSSIEDLKQKTDSPAPELIYEILKDTTNF